MGKTYTVCHSLFSCSVILHAFCCLLIKKRSYLFQQQQNITNTIRVSNNLDPDQAQLFVGPDLGPNCFERL